MCCMERMEVHLQGRMCGGDKFYNLLTSFPSFTFCSYPQEGSNSLGLTSNNRWRCLVSTEDEDLLLKLVIC